MDEGTVCVSQSEFDGKVEALAEEMKGSKTFMRRACLEKIKVFLENSGKSQYDYYCRRNYELVKFNDESHVIAKRKDQKDVFIYIVPLEDFFSKLLEVHTLIGHGGRDKMIYHIKKKWRIPRSVVSLFISCCVTCNLKRTAPSKGVVVKPIITDGFNMRAQVDLVDFQSCPDGEYHWLMNYQDHATKFLQLRPLKSKHAANVAEELVKIFSIFGAPAILQSDNGREFVAAVIKELVDLWPNCKIVHSRPRHPQSQGSIERANGDVENMLRAWMIDNRSNNWSRGCYEVQVNFMMLNKFFHFISCSFNIFFCF